MVPVLSYQPIHAEIVVILRAQLRERDRSTGHAGSLSF
jgi:hypothetical protein